MALRIKSDRVDRLARELAALTGQSITEAVEESLEARLEAVRRRPAGLDDVVDRFSVLPVLDERTDDAILGGGDDGLPT